MPEVSAPPRSLRIASVRGVPVFLSSTWLLGAILIAVLGWDAASDLAPGRRVGYIVVVVLSVLVSVLAHEAGHALAGKAAGLTVHQIVADLWGGHTSFATDRLTPGRSVATAAAGPAVNLLLWGLTMVLGSVVPSISPWISAFGWFNIALAVFNLLPGLPLDGGQIVEGAVWGATGRRWVGTMVAGWLGYAVVAAVVVWLLVLPLTRGESLSMTTAFVVVFVAWHLASGARSALARARVLRALDPITVQDVLIPAHVLPPDTPVSVARGAPGVTLGLDAHGIPRLMAQLAPEVPDDAPVESTYAVLPAENVLEIAAHEPVHRVISAIAQTRVGVVVVTAGGAAYGIVLQDDVVARAVPSAGH